MSERPLSRRTAPSPGRSRCRAALLVGLAVAALALSGPAASAAAWGERILGFRSEIQVRRDGSMTVTETIRVRANRQKIRRGIYRDFPTRYTSRWGTKVVVDFTPLSVTRDGRPEPYHTQRISNGVRLYVGRENVFLEPGDYTYAISYRTDRQLGFFEDHDELYWNATGNGWAFPIDEAQAVVALPGEVAAVDMTMEAYTGPPGQKGRQYTAAVDEEGRAVFECTRRLGPQEGMSIVLTWPKGLVIEPTAWQEARWFLRDNLGLVLGALGLAGVFAYYLLVWMQVGKDPERGTIIPLYEPPEGLSPAAVRFVTRMGYDDKAFAAAVLSMASKGYLKISETGGVYKLERMREDTASLSPEEVQIANKLLRSRKSIRIKRTYHSTISGAIEKLKTALKAAFEVKYFATNRKHFIGGLVASLVVALVCTVVYNPGPALFLCVWLSIWTLGVGALVFQAIVSWRAVFGPPGSRGTALATALGTSLFALPFLGAEAFGVWALWNETSATVIALVFVLAGVNYAFYHWLKAPTLAGRKLLDRIEGFRMYLAVAEKERLNLLNPPERTPELFERYLPYALALDVEQQWSQQFSDVLAKAAEEGTTYSPGWYSGRGWTRMGAGGFASSFGSSFASAAASSSVAPGSVSGGGGGGSSGGGGGGGGGGGW